MKIQRILLTIITSFLVLFTLISTSQESSLAPLQEMLATAQALVGSNVQFLPLIRNSGPAAPTPTKTPTKTPVITSGPSPTVPPTLASDWTQYGHDAQHTSYTSQFVATPWHWKWSWNGPTASGGVSAGKFKLPRNVQPVTGGGRVYIAAGAQGVYALNVSNGSQAWNQNAIGEINSTPAYDAQSDTLFVVSANGHLYRLNAANGQSNGDFNGQATSTLALPPSISGDRVYFSMGNHVFAINKNSMAQAWAYDAGSPVQIPPAVSPATGRVVAASQDLYVHAINDLNGTRAWRVKPTPLTPGDPASSPANSLAELSYGWPVIAEAHGLVLVRYRLDWQTMWTWTPWPTSNATMRTNLTNTPTEQSVFALHLSDGGTAFVSNVGNGGFGDGGRINIGPPPVVKRFSDGSEVAYVIMRGAACLPNAQTPCEGRNDSRLGELMLDGSTVSGFQAGDVRFMQNNIFIPTDEQPTLTMANNDIFQGHWMFGAADRITNRGASLGSGSGNPITMSTLPPIITSTSTCAFSSSHYCSPNMTQDSDPRGFPAGFYIYHNQGTVYNQYWRSYSTWIESGGLVYFLSNDGALIALENGTTVQSGVAEATPEPPAAAPLELAQPIPYPEAWDHAGQIASVEGEVKFEFNNGREVLLGFEKPHMGAFKGMILVEDWQNFSAPPETLYPVGARIRIHGLIDWFQGDPVIYVHSPDQIEVLSDPGS